MGIIHTPKKICVYCKIINFSMVIISSLHHATLLSVIFITAHPKWNKKKILIRFTLLFTDYIDVYLQEALAETQRKSRQRIEDREKELQELRRATQSLTVSLTMKCAFLVISISFSIFILTKLFVFRPLYCLWWKQDPEFHGIVLWYFFFLWETTRFGKIAWRGISFKLLPF